MGIWRLDGQTVIYKLVKVIRMHLVAGASAAEASTICGLVHLILACDLRVMASSGRNGPWPLALTHWVCRADWA